MEDIENKYVSWVEMDFDNISIAASVLRESRNSMVVSNSIFDFNDSNRFSTPCPGIILTAISNQYHSAPLDP